MADLIANRFEILSKLGEGGQGAVYKARHVDLDHVVALKLLPGHLAEDVDLLARFRREAKVQARFKHPNIVRVTDIVSEAGQSYLVMDFIEGQDLRRHMRAHGRLSIPAALEITSQVGGALAYAHERQVVHRDIKPSNIILESLDPILAMLFDFGIAKEEDSADHTRTGALVGSYRYSAPEQLGYRRSVRGGAPVPIDGRTDVYALGLVLFEMLEGKAFFAGLQEHEVIGRVIYDSAPLTPEFSRELPAALREIVARAIQRDPDDRYASMRDLLRAVRACQDESWGEDETTTGRSRSTRTRPQSSRTEAPATGGLPPRGQGRPDFTSTLTVPAHSGHGSDPARSLSDAQLEAQLATLDTERRRLQAFAAHTAARQVRATIDSGVDVTAIDDLCSRGEEQLGRAAEQLQRNDHRQAGEAYEQARQLFAEARRLAALPRQAGTPAAATPSRSSAGEAVARETPTLSEEERRRLEAAIQSERERVASARAEAEALSAPNFAPGPFAEGTTLQLGADALLEAGDLEESARSYRAASEAFRDACAEARKEGELAAANEARSEAEAVLEKAAGIPMPEETSARLDAARAALADGVRSLASGKPVPARAFFVDAAKLAEEARAEAEWVLEEQRRRAEGLARVQEARVRAEAARSDAGASRAPELAPDRYREAEGLADAAQLAERDERFSEAVDAFERTTRAFAAAAEEARRETARRDEEARRLREEALRARRSAEQARDAAAAADAVGNASEEHARATERFAAAEEAERSGDAGRAARDFVAASEAFGLARELAVAARERKRAVALRGVAEEARAAAEAAEAPALAAGAHAQAATLLAEGVRALETSPPDVALAVDRFRHAQAAFVGAGKAARAERAAIRQRELEAERQRRAAERKLALAASERARVAEAEARRGRAAELAPALFAAAAQLVVTGQTALRQEEFVRAAEAFERATAAMFEATAAAVAEAKRRENERRERERQAVDGARAEALSAREDAGTANAAVLVPGAFSDAEAKLAGAAAIARKEDFVAAKVAYEGAREAFVDAARRAEVELRRRAEVRRERQGAVRRARDGAEQAQQRADGAGAKEDAAEAYAAAVALLDRAAGEATAEDFDAAVATLLEAGRTFERAFDAALRVQASRTIEAARSEVAAAAAMAEAAEAEHLAKEQLGRAQATLLRADERARSSGSDAERVLEILERARSEFLEAAERAENERAAVAERERAEAERRAAEEAARREAEERKRREEEGRKRQEAAQLRQAEEQRRKEEARKREEEAKRRTEEEERKRLEEVRLREAEEQRREEEERKQQEEAKRSAEGEERQRLEEVRLREEERQRLEAERRELLRSVDASRSAASIARAAAEAAQAPTHAAVLFERASQLLAQAESEVARDLLAESGVTFAAAARAFREAQGGAMYVAALRRSADGARTEAAGARRGAEASGAPHLSPQLFDQGLDLWAQGEESLALGNLQEAANRFSAAASFLREAESAAIATAALRRATDEQTRALAEREAARASGAEEYAGTTFAHASEGLVAGEALLKRQDLAGSCEAFRRAAELYREAAAAALERHRATSIESDGSAEDATKLREDTAAPIRDESTRVDSTGTAGGRAIRKDGKRKGKDDRRTRQARGERAKPETLAAAPETPRSPAGTAEETPPRDSVGPSSGGPKDAPERARRADAPGTPATLFDFSDESRTIVRADAVPIPRERDDVRDGATAPRRTPDLPIEASARKAPLPAAPVTARPRAGSIHAIWGSLAATLAVALVAAWLYSRTDTVREPVPPHPEPSSAPMPSPPAPPPLAFERLIPAPASPLTLAEGKVLVFEADVAPRAKGEAVSYSWLVDGEPSGEGRTFTYTPGFEDGGKTRKIAVIASLATQTAEHAWTVRIDDVNRAPTIASSKPTSASLDLEVGAAQLFQVEASDPDRGDRLQYRWERNGKEIASGSSATWTLSGATPDDREVRVTVSDAAGSKAEVRSWRLAVAKPAPEPPVPPKVLGQVPPGDKVVRLREGEAVDLQVRVASAAGAPGETTQTWFVDGKEVRRGAGWRFEAPREIAEEREKRRIEVEVASKATGAKAARVGWNVEIAWAPPVIAEATPKKSTLAAAAGEALEFAVRTRGVGDLQAEWTVDGRKAATKDGRLRLADGLEPGEHEVVVAAVDGRSLRSAERSWTVTVGPMATPLAQAASPAPQETAIVARGPTPVPMPPLGSGAVERVRQWLSDYEAALNRKDTDAIARLRGLAPAQREALRKSIQEQEGLRVKFTNIAIREEGNQIVARYVRTDEFTWQNSPQKHSVNEEQIFSADGAQLHRR